MSCDPPCQHGKCVIELVEGLQQAYCKCYRMYSGPACEIPWTDVWGDYWLTFYYCFMTLFSVLGCYGLYIWFHSSQADLREDEGDALSPMPQSYRSGPMDRLMMCGLSMKSFALLMLNLAVWLRVAEHFDATGARGWYPKATWRLLNGLGYITLAAGILAFLFHTAQTLMERTHSLFGGSAEHFLFEILSPTLPTTALLLMIASFLVDVMLELVLARNVEPRWARVSKVVFFFLLFLFVSSLLLSAAKGMSRAVQKLKEPNHPVPYAPTFESVCSMLWLSVWMCVLIAVAVVVWYAKGLTWLDAWDTYVAYCVLRPLEFVVLSSFLYAYRTLQCSREFSKDLD